MATESSSAILREHPAAYRKILRGKAFGGTFFSHVTLETHVTSVGSKYHEDIRPVQEPERASNPPVVGAGTLCILGFSAAMVSHASKGRGGERVTCRRRLPWITAEIRRNRSCVSYAVGALTDMPDEELAAMSRTCDEIVGRSINRHQPGAGSQG
jgi:hypothetical protein